MDIYFYVHGPEPEIPLHGFTMTDHMAIHLYNTTIYIAIPFRILMNSYQIVCNGKSVSAEISNKHHAWQ